MRDKFLQILVIIISSVLIIQLFFLQVINNENSDIVGKASVQKIFYNLWTENEPFSKHYFSLNI